MKQRIMRGQSNAQGPAVNIRATYSRQSRYPPCKRHIQIYKADTTLDILHVYRKTETSIRKRCLTPGISGLRLPWQPDQLPDSPSKLALSFDSWKQLQLKTWKSICILAPNSDGITIWAPSVWCWRLWYTKTSQPFTFHSFDTRSNHSLLTPPCLMTLVKFPVVECPKGHFFSDNVSAIATGGWPLWVSEGAACSCILGQEQQSRFYAWCSH